MRRIGDHHHVPAHHPHVGKAGGAAHTGRKMNHGNAKKGPPVSTAAHKGGVKHTTGEGSTKGFMPAVPHGSMKLRPIRSAARKNLEKRKI